MTAPSPPRPSGRPGPLGRTLALELVLPLAVFYGMRALGADQFLALLLAAALPAAHAVHGIAVHRRVSGVTLFVLGTMVLTVAMSLITGSPRALLIRDAWASAAMGLWTLATLAVGRPLLYSGTLAFLSGERAATWRRNWERFPEFRHAMRVSTGVWGGIFLCHTAVQIAMAASLPIDLVPALEPVLLAVTVLALFSFQKLYGDRYLRRHGLRMHGVELSRRRPDGQTPAPVPPPAPHPTGEGRP
ncbi:VC0807 family protein [Allonocardiopsis opalescens]|uniref:Intracellular septation protein A n=1 Tax=Allonocardiopsis opalescens TaxID=1144618 RepID=A0A2T0QED1_9ACTN|nr:VC0807 family protein [Allonocardiopsis opalescens]PRY02279.1 hypothetical protein CLV72_101881 [Allonocardiopsis opalescens]